jgi:hypothetical protein
MFKVRFSRVAGSAYWNFRQLSAIGFEEEVSTKDVVASIGRFVATVNARLTFEFLANVTIYQHHYGHPAQHRSTSGFRMFSSCSAGLRKEIN